LTHGPPAAIRDLKLTNAQMAVVILAGVVTLVLGFKVAKLLFKLVLLLIALGCLGFGVLWFLS
jgi:hypothetical protein